MQSIPVNKNPSLLNLLTDIPNMITLGGLLCAITAIFFILREDLELGAMMLLGYGVCDLSDGRVARRLQGARPLGASEFGAQIDNLTDAVAAGVGSALLSWRLAGEGYLGIVVATLLIVAGVIRLSYFGAFANLNPGFFRGLPITDNVPFIALLTALRPVLAGEAGKAVTVSVVLILVILHVSPFKLRKLGRGAYIGYSAVAVVLSGILLLEHTR